jgi:hypothetical protein
MGKYFGTIRYDKPGDLEVLNFEPSWREEPDFKERIILCPVENRELYIEMIDSSHAIGAILTEGEVEMLIGALLETKKRWNK